MAGSVKQDVLLRGEGAPDGRPDGNKSASTIEGAGHAAYERYYHKGAGGNAAVRFGSRARAGQRVRVRSAREQRHWVRRSRWVSASVAVVIGGVLAVVGFVAFQQLRLPEVAEDAALPAVVVEGEQQDGEPASEQPPNDVARERAALDALPEE